MTLKTKGPNDECLSFLTENHISLKTSCGILNDQKLMPTFIEKHNLLMNTLCLCKRSAEDLKEWTANALPHTRKKEPM